MAILALIQKRLFKYHERAEDCRRLAQIGPVAMKASYLRLAEAYEQMARHEARHHESRSVKAP